ncbi:MAG TPA: crotonase/enoyl-CoA hydratase family protein [Acidimicrobiales bacterium]|nr:crotonase/enoyl-CoA hydratase family protein [Acidimicrobiales bacterium]
MSEQRVTVTIEDHVADVRFNRPDKINALDGEQFAAIVDAGEELKANPDVRAVVLSGNGRGFCAGLDFSSFQAMAGGGGGGGEKPEASPRPRRGIMDLEGRITHLGQQACYVWQEMPCPVIAAVHGVALGGGAQIALGADMRIVAPDAQISILEIRWGLIPDMTGTAMLPLLVGLDRAKELTFTGRMVSGTEAAQIGLATRVSESPLDDALALAREIASKSPTAVRGAKKLLNASPYRGVAEQFADERATIGSLIGSPNQVEAVMAYFEKRDPNFVD